MEQLKKGVSVLMPCLNEEKTVGNCVERAREVLQEYAWEGEILVIDNGSEDASAEKAEVAGARVIQVSQKGYGVALAGGISCAKYEYVLMLDADGSYDVREGMAFLEKLEAGFDLVIGNRFLGEIHAGAMPWLHQHIGNPVLSAIGRKWSGAHIGDFHCGMRAFRKEKMEELKLEAEQMEFASEMIMKAAGAGLKMAEVPCCLYPDGREGKSHLRTVRDGIRHLICLWKNRR